MTKGVEGVPIGAYLLCCLLKGKTVMLDDGAGAGNWSKYCSYPNDDCGLTGFMLERLTISKFESLLSGFWGNWGTDTKLQWGWVLSRELVKNHFDHWSKPKHGHDSCPNQNCL
jgi:hypothetical protein